jgi:hypothetical protein
MWFTPSFVHFTEHVASFRPMLARLSSDQGVCEVMRGCPQPIGA